MAPRKRLSKEERLKQDVQRILADLKRLQRDRLEAGEEREEIGEDVDKIIEDVEFIKKDIEETGDDVEEIKEEIHEIKQSVGQLSRTARAKGMFSRVAGKVLPDKFASKDIAQQIVGAMVLSAPFTVTEEVWNLANNLAAINVIAVITLTVVFDVLLYYFTRYQEVEEKSFFLFPRRILSLLIVTYATTAIVLSVFGVIGGQIQDGVWAAKLIVMVGLFANIGAGAADLIR